VMCACPHTRDELLAVGSDLAPMLVPLVSPPVATARYLHALHGRSRVHLTYVGACPAGSDEALDVHRMPGEFLASLATAGIGLTDQPRVFDSVIPPDRRRFFSIAGGVPSAEQLWSAGNGRSLVEIDGEDYLIDLAQHLLSHECALIDIAPRLGCACSGASSAVPARSARAAVAVIDPPRATSAVVDMTVPVELNAPITIDTAPVDVGRIRPSLDASGTDPIPSQTTNVFRPTPSLGPASQPKGSVPQRRRSPAAGIRAIQASVPIAHVAGRRLPRAYVASRRAPQAIVPAQHIEPHVTRIPAAPLEPGTDDNGRSRSPARVAAARPSGKAAIVAAGAAGSPDRMGDGPRS